MKKVMVSTGKRQYTYETDLPVRVGDKVVLPGPSGGEFVGTVTSLTSRYTGPCKQVVRAANDDDLAKAR